MMIHSISSALFTKEDDNDDGDEDEDDAGGVVDGEK